LNYKTELAPFIKGWSAMANVQAADDLPPGFEGFDTPMPPDTSSALRKQFESARKGQPFQLGPTRYEVRVNHGYVSDVPGMPRGSRGYMVLVFDAKLSPQERAAAKGGGTTTLVLDTATDKVYLYPWATTRTDSRGVPKGKPARVVGRRTEMNERQEKDIIRTLCKAGHESLAKTFARSRGYRVRGWEDQLPGGLADKDTPDEFDPKQLKMGIRVEMEHTDDPKLAREIAIDHLKEIPDYYSRLAEMEKEAEALGPGRGDI
jgi:hypothetical protein